MTLEEDLALLGFAFTKTTHDKPSPNLDPSKVTLGDGFTVLIVGASEGIGEYIARAYASAKASNIIITGRTPSKLDRVKKELESINPKVKVTTAPGDSTKAETFVELRRLMATEYDGRLDTLVYNSGAGPANGGWNKTFDDIAPEDFLASTVINYVGPFYAAKYLMGLLQNHKTIINITSAVSQCSKAGHMLAPYYSISKFAQNRLSQWIGETFADEGINCIGLHPGACHTPGNGAVQAKSKEFHDAIEPYLVDDVGLCGAVCVWFSKESRQWASGRYFSSNWDYDEVEQRKEEIVKRDLLKSSTSFG